MTGVAVKVTIVPSQKLVCDADILTDAITGELIFITILFEVAVCDVRQPARLLVITQVTVCPLVSVDVV